MATVTVYAREGCPHCASAKALLASEGIPHAVVDVGESKSRLGELAALAGEPPDKITVPKITIGDTLIRSNDELQALAVRSALVHLAGPSSVVTKPRQPLPGGERRGGDDVCVLHTGETSTPWLAELHKRLAARGASVVYVDVERVGSFDLGGALPFGVVVNRVSDAVPPGLARYVTSLLAFASATGVPTVNGAGAYSTATSKVTQHGLFTQCGLKSPQSAVVRCSADVAAAAQKFEGHPILFKPNAGSFGKGIVKFTDLDALAEHASKAASYGNDGVALLQRYHEPGVLRRAFLLGGEVLCAVDVAVAGADTFSGYCMASAEKRRKLEGGPPPVTRVELPEDVAAACRKLMAVSQADVGSVEYLLDAESGDALFFDLNLLSTFPSPEVAGRDCWDDLAVFIVGKAAASRK